MRKITAGMFISLDGVVEDPQNWHFPYFNDEMGEAVQGQMGTADTMLFGHSTYAGFAEAWPEREAAGGPDAGMARHFGDIRKIVVSHSDLEFTWRNSEQLRFDTASPGIPSGVAVGRRAGLIEAVTALKQTEGGDIGMSGSVSVVRQLLAAELIDELHLLVHPIVLRAGQRLFDEGDAPIPLELLRSATFKTGVVHLVYGPGELREGGYEQATEHL